MRGVLAAEVEAVVDLAANEPPHVFARGQTHARFPLLDGGGNPAWLLRTALLTLAELLRSSVPTFVFCSAGMSRSVVVAAAALAVVHQRPLSETLGMVAGNGPADVSPGLLADVESVLQGHMCGENA